MSTNETFASVAAAQAAALYAFNTEITSSVVLGAGIFVLIYSLLKTVFTITDQINGAQQAGSWGTRKAFTSVIITNLPMVFHLMRQLLQPVLGSILGSLSNTKYNNYNNGSTGFRTIGGGGGGNNRSRHTTNRDGNVSDPTFGNDSEEHIVRGIRMDIIQQSHAYATGPKGNEGPVPAMGIVMTNEFEIMDDQNSVTHAV
ncbi:hypothetical protein SCUCBS95973_008336 [Sporothrix curviconia]|uniref:Uncharacterized protein n=1 Tax=Sporothrix curviconia TaxID=1260050 RepID=A0ABP0CLH2_9PEZI